MKIKPFLLVIFSLFLIACETKISSTSLETNKPQRDTLVAKQEKNIAVVKKFFEYEDNHQWNEMAKIWSSMPPDYEQSARESLIRDIRTDIVQIYPSGDRYVIVKLIKHLKFRNNSNWDPRICSIITIENGIITNFDSFKQEVQNFER